MAAQGLCKGCAVGRIVNTLGRLVPRLMLRLLGPLSAGLAALFVWSAGLAAHARVSPPAQKVLNRARAVTGGESAWNAVRGLHETGQDGEARYERWLDPLRYGLRIETSS